MGSGLLAGYLPGISNASPSQIFRVGDLEKEFVGDRVNMLWSGKK